MLHNEMPPIFDERKMEELVKEAKKANAADRQMADYFEGLINSATWRLYCDLIDTRVQGFSDVLMQPAGGSDGAWRQEFVKGAMYGLLLARNLPSVIVGAMREISEPQENSNAS